MNNKQSIYDSKGNEITYLERCIYNVYILGHFMKGCPESELTVDLIRQFGSELMDTANDLKELTSSNSMGSFFY